MGGREKCALALFAAYAKYTGAHFDAAAEARLMSKFGQDGHAAAVYARASARYLEAAADKALQEGHINPTLAKTLGQAEKWGIPVKGLFSYVMEPAHIMGPSIPDRVHQLTVEHLRAHGNQAKHAWTAEVVPELKQLKESTLNAVSPIYRDYVEKYFDKQIQGGQLYGQFASQSPFGKLARNAVHNLVDWNPLITTLNVFEYTPKALAYAVGKQGAAGVGTVLRAYGDYLSATGGKFWSRIPELERAGVYGAHTNGTGILNSGVHSLLDVTENPLRGLSYHLGEAISPGLGHDALEKVAFVSKFGNEPMAFMDAAGTDTLALMRYGFASSKMYLSMWNRARKGDVNAVGALVAFSAMTAIQTGSSSAVPLPGPLYDAMPGDLKQALADFDERTNLNLTQKFLGTDLSNQTRPLSVPALGAGLSMATEDIQGTVSGVGKAATSLSEGDYQAAAGNTLKALFSGAQLAKIPGVNLTTKRMVDSLAAVLTDDQSVEDVPQDVLKRTRLYQEPKVTGNP